MGFSDDFTDTVLKHTLAYSLANNEEKEQLRDVFKLICNHVINTFPDPHERVIFSRSLISSEVYTNMKAEIDNLELNEIGKDELLIFSIRMIWDSIQLKKFFKFIGEQSLELYLLMTLSPYAMAILAIVLPL